MAENKIGPPLSRPKFQIGKLAMRTDSETEFEDDTSSMAPASVTSASSCFKEEIDIADLPDTVIDKNCSKGCLW